MFLKEDRSNLKSVLIQSNSNQRFPLPFTILDVGGTVNFWKQMDFLSNPGIKITILNNEDPAEVFPGITIIKGDARDLSMFSNNEFDTVFSNSVIEHVGDFYDQQRMANEIIRAGKRYFIQTPNYYFPIEPHFLFPFFQFMPDVIKVFLLKHFDMGWYKKCKNTLEAKEIINSVNLLDLKKLKKLFKSGNIYKEKVLFLTKSFIIHHL